MIYLFTVCDAFEIIPGVSYLMDVRHNTVAQGVARYQINSFKYEDYVRVYNGRALNNVTNRRIGCELNRVCLIIFI